MTQAIRQSVNIQPGGMVEFKAPQLHEGERVDVIVLYEPSAGKNDDGCNQKSRGLERYFGMAANGDAHGSDNQRIDDDLTREYAQGLKHLT